MTFQMDHGAQTVDLLDAANNRIEHVRSMAWNLAERIDHLLGRGVVGGPLVGELNALHDLASEAQEVLDELTRRERPALAADELLEFAAR